MTNIKSISKLLFKPTDKLELKLSVGILDGNMKEKFFNTYQNGKLVYATVDIQPTLRLIYKVGDWSKDKQLIINQSNIYQLIDGLTNFRSILYREGLFYDNDGTVAIDMTAEDTLTLNNIGQGQWIKLEPTIIYDEGDRSMVGINLFINNSFNCIDLSIDEYESILYSIRNINLSLEGQLLLNTYIMMQGRVDNSNNVRAVNPALTKQSPKLIYNVTSENNRDVDTTSTTTGGRFKRDNGLPI